MAEIPKEEQEKIIKALLDAGARLPCPRCGNGTFTLASGYLTQSVLPDPFTVVIGGTSIPSIVVICRKCGFMAQHALGPLGLMPPAPEPAKAETQVEGESK
jgi:ribosomal protein S27AE